MLYFTFYLFSKQNKATELLIKCFQKNLRLSIIRFSVPYWLLLHSMILQYE